VVLDTAGRIGFRCAACFRKRANAVVNAKAELAKQYRADVGYVGTLTQWMKDHGYSTKSADNRKRNRNLRLDVDKIMAVLD